MACLCLGPKCIHRIYVAQEIIQILGGLVCIAFGMQGVLIIIGPAVGHDDRPTDDFWTFCHWASEAILCILVGAVLLVMELRACCPTVSQRLGRHMLSSYARALLYLWIGAYSCGGRIAMGDLHWQLLGEITGIAAWVACIGHLVFACVINHPKKEQEEEEEEQRQDEEQARGEEARPASAPESATEQPQEETQQEVGVTRDFAIADDFGGDATVEAVV